METLKEYFSENIEITNDDYDRINRTDLFKSFIEKKSVKDINQRRFNSLVEELGIPKKDSNGKRFFSGIKYKKQEVQEKEQEVQEKEQEVQKKSKIKDFIKFSDCSIYLPKCKIINEIPNVDYLLDFKIKLKDAYNNLLIPKLNSQKEYCDFYKKILNNDIEEITKLNEDLKSISLILVTGEIYSKHNFNREYKLYESYKEFLESEKNGK
jgi:hypothetical protein